MADFDLSQALDDTTLEDPLDCFSCDADETKIPDCSLGVKLDISCNHKTMQRVVNLVIAVNRMKNKCSDQQLYSAIFDTIIEAKTIEMLGSSGNKKEYQRVNSVTECTLCDFAQKDLVHVSEGLKLHAITLKGGYGEQKVTFLVSRYIMTDCTADKPQPVILSIRNYNLHITCTMEDGKAVLNLEERSETELRRISSDRNMDRFLFYGSVKGISETKFESVNCPGWFISTSSYSENQPVEMCQVDCRDRILSFRVG